jgi:hypothetical protein
MKKKVALISAAVLALTLSPMKPADAVITPQLCNGMTADKEWLFNDAPGSTIAKESLNGATADDLIQPAGYTGAIFTGGTLQTNGHTVVEGRAPNTTFVVPDGHNFCLSVSWRFQRDANGNILDPDGYNLWALGRTSTTHSFMKGMPSYAADRAVDLLQPRLEDVGSSAIGWHVSTVTKVGNVYTLYLDGAKTGTQYTTTQDLGHYDFSQSPLAIGGKYVPPGASDVGTEDIGMWVYAQVLWAVS